MSNNVARLGRIVVTSTLITFALYPLSARGDKLGAKPCSDALAIAHAVMKKHAISPRLAASFRKFRLSNCDLATDFERDTPTDEAAFGEFRVKLIALGTR